MSAIINFDRIKALGEQAENSGQTVITSMNVSQHKEVHKEEEKTEVLILIQWLSSTRDLRHCEEHSASRL